jgi:uncharacterized protein (DUF697 family)
LLENFWKRLSSWGFAPFWGAVERAVAAADEEVAEEARSRAAAMAPIIWLLGKTGSGKSSIVSILTGDPKADIGEGYKPCTARSVIFDWPKEAPILRFLDTRGLGEPGYHPSEDIAYAETQAHVLLVAMKAADPSQSEIISVIEKIRLKHPEWPIVVAQTTLHNLYPHRATHPPIYHYKGTDADDANAALPPDVRRALRYQRELFSAVPGRPPIFVPLDFTLPEDGFAPTDFGVEALNVALIDVGVDVLRRIEESFAQEINDEIAQKARALILGHAAAAGFSGAVPIPVVGIGGLAGLVGHMLHTLAERYDVEWSKARIAEFTGAIGLGALLTFGLRYLGGEMIKLIPVEGTIVGGAFNAAGAFALVYAIGVAACLYLGKLRKGQAVSPDQIREAFSEALQAAFRNSAGDKEKSASEADKLDHTRP